PLRASTARRCRRGPRRGCWPLMRCCLCSRACGCCGGGTSEMPPPPCPGGTLAPSESHVAAAKHIRRAAAPASAAYFAPPVRQGMPAVPVRDSDLQHHRNDHRSAAVGVAHPAAHRAAHHTADLLHVDHPVGGLSSEERRE